MTERSAHRDVRALDADERLLDLDRTDLLDSPVEASFERFTALVSRALDAPVSLVTLVDDSRQFFKSQRGLVEPWRSSRGTALSHSFCQHVVTADAPFVVTDARTDDRVADNRAVEELSVVAYAGAPLHGPAGTPIGSLCAIDVRPRTWTDSDIALLQELADVVSDYIAMRAAAVARRAAVQDLSHRLRTGLAALQLEAEDALAVTRDADVVRSVSHVLDGLGVQATVLDAALREASALELGHEEQLDLHALVTDVAERGGSHVVVLPSEGPAAVRAPRPALARVLDAVVGVVQEHGGGAVELSVVTSDASVLRVRARAEAALPAAVGRDLSVRQDGGATGSAPLSLAERAARAVGGRLVQTASSPVTLDLVLPRATGTSDAGRPPSGAGG